MSAAEDWVEAREGQPTWAPRDAALDVLREWRKGTDQGGADRGDMVATDHEVVRRVQLEQKQLARKLLRILGDGADQAARWSAFAMSALPSVNLTPAADPGQAVSPFSHRQVFGSAMASLKTVSRALSCERPPFVRMVRCRTVAKISHLWHQRR